MFGLGSVVIGGLENCKLDSEKEVRINAYKDFVQRAVLEPVEDGKIKLSIDFRCDDNKSGFALRDMIYDIARRIVYQLLEKQLDIYNVSFEEPQINYKKSGKFCAEAFITITNIIDGTQEKSINDIEISLEDYNKRQVAMVNLLEEKSDVLKYTNLYQRLKDLCGNQRKVTERIKSEFAEAFNINCDNENIDEDYARKHSWAKYQDDFTYLRTMIAHGGEGKYSDEIYRRLYKDTVKIIKAINVLEKEHINN